MVACAITGNISTEATKPFGNIFAEATRGVSCWFYVSAVLAILALFAFALAAERVTDALDEGELDQYLGSMLIYNLGVIFILWSLAAFLWIKGYPALFWIPGVLSLYPWIKDAGWLIFASQKSKDEYRKKLLATE
jgi:hypothetical protein